MSKPSHTPEQIGLRLRFIAEQTERHERLHSCPSDDCFICWPGDIADEFWKFAHQLAPALVPDLETVETSVHELAGVQIKEEGAVKKLIEAALEISGLGVSDYVMVDRELTAALRAALLGLEIRDGE